MKPILVAEQILEYIPQRPPIVMIDKLWASNEEGTKTGLLIRPDLLFVENGYFTEPGLMENIAQTGAIRAGYYHISRNEPVPLGFIGDFKNLIIHQLPAINQEITTVVQLKGEVLGISVFEGKVYLDDQLLVSCEMKIFVQKEPETFKK